MKFKTGREYRLVYASLGVAMLVGGCLRLHDVTANGLWLDEAFSVAISDPDHSFLDVCKQTLTDVHPAFYQLLLWCFYKIFGWGEMTGRYLSVTVGVLFIPSIFFLGRQLISERVGLIAAGLSAVNFYLITYSQETRSYALLALLTTLSFVCFIIAIRKSSVLNVCVYALVAAMLINTHYFGFFPVIAQVLLFFIFCKSPFYSVFFLRFAAAGLFMLLTVVPGILYIFENFKRQGFWVQAPDDRFFLELFNLYFGNQFLSIMFAVFLVMGLGRLMKDESKSEVLRVLAVWVVVGIVIPYMRSLYFQPIMTMRNLIVLLPAVLLMLAFSISFFTDRVVLCCLAVVIFCFSMTPLYTSFKPGFTFQNQLRPVSEMRDVVKMMMKEYSSELVYSPVAIQMQGYLKVFDSSLKVYGIEVMERDLLSAKRPSSFFIVATRGVWMPDDNYMKAHKFNLIKEKVIGDSLINEYQSLPE